MNKINIAISLVTGAFLIFTILCLPVASAPLGFLFMFLLLLQVGLVWMVIIILKYGTPSKHTFDEKFYEDQDF